MAFRTHLIFCLALATGACSAGTSNELATPARASSHPLAAGPHWSMYGHDAQNTQHNPDETRLGVESAASLQELWRVKLPSGATSEPIVADGTMYFGGWDGRVHAVDARSGELRWQSVVTNMYVRSTPLVTEERVYVAAGGSLVALDRASGAVLFDKLLDPEPTVLLDGSPKAVDDLIIVGVAAGENTGPKDDYTFVGSIQAIDAVSGELVWKIETTGERGGTCTGGAGVGVWTTAAVDPELGLLYMGTGENYEEPAGNCEDSLMAIHYARGHAGERIAWKVQYNMNDIFLVYFPFVGLDGDVGASPNLFEAAGRKLVGAGDKAGTYRTFDRLTGQLVWRTNLAVGDNTGIGGVMTTAAVGSDALYVTSNAVSSEATSTLYALDLLTGSPRWQASLPSLSFGGITLANGVLYHVLADGTFYARDAATGRELKKLALGNANGASPTVIDGRVYVSTGMAVTADLSQPADGIVMAFGLPDEAQGAPRVIDAGPIPPAKAATPADCHATLARNNPAPSSVCSDCLCECNATAWASCPWCWDLAPCTSLLCAFSAPGPDLEACVQDNCLAKLIPAGQFQQSLDVAPCVQRCSLACAL